MKKYTLDQERARKIYLSEYGESLNENTIKTLLEMAELLSLVYDAWQNGLSITDIFPVKEVTA